MYKRILIATDGSPLSCRAIKTGIEIAKLANASTLGIHVRLPMGYLLYGDAALHTTQESEAAYRNRMQAISARYLDEIGAAARTAGVPFEPIDLEDASPADAILRTAQAKGCDLIVMASRGRRGLAGMLMGSEAIKVLTHATQPVLVIP